MTSQGDLVVGPFLRSVRVWDVVVGVVGGGAFVGEGNGGGTFIVENKIFNDVRS